MSLAEATVADALADRLSQRGWDVDREPSVGNLRPDFILQRSDGLSLVAELTLESGFVHVGSLGHAAAYKGLMAPGGQGEYGYVLLTTGSTSPEIEDLARQLRIGLISVPSHGEAAVLAATFADKLESFDRFAGLGPPEDRWRLAPLFEKATETELARLSSSVERVRFAAGDEIYPADSPPDELYVVLAGVVELVLPGGRLLAERKPLSVFGEMAALDGEPRLVTARARTDVELSVVPASAFLHLLSTSAAVREALYRVLAHINRELAREAPGGVEVLRGMATVMRRATRI